jgi:hypothetical protein
VEADRRDFAPPARELGENAAVTAGMLPRWGNRDVRDGIRVGSAPWRFCNSVRKSDILHRMVTKTSAHSHLLATKVCEPVREPSLTVLCELCLAECCPRKATSS